MNCLISFDIVNIVLQLQSVLFLNAQISIIILGQRRHNLVLTAQNSLITDRDFINKMLIRDICLCCYMFSCRLLLLFNTVHFILFLTLAMYTFSYVSYSRTLVVVCQLGLKSWLIDWLIDYAAYLTDSKPYTKKCINKFFGFARTDSMTDIIISFKLPSQICPDSVRFGHIL